MHTAHRPTRRALSPLLGLAALAALGPAARPADATQLNFDTTINYAINSDVFVGSSDSNGDPPFSPTVNLVSGGSIDGIVQINTASVFNMRGGSISDELWSFDTSTVNVSGGSVGSFVGAIEPYHINSSLTTYNHSAFNISGGTFGQSNGVTFLDETTGQFNFIGRGLSFAPDPGGKTIDGGTDYTLTGLLQDGHSITGDVIEVAGGAAMFTLTNAAPVPEASTAVPLGLGMLCLACLAGLTLAGRTRAEHMKTSD